MKIRGLTLIAFLLIANSELLVGQRISTLDYINKYKYISIKEMLDYKIPASITLAQAILESSSGNSSLATEANNHFGIKCHNDWTGEKIYKDDDEKNECFRVYKSAEYSFRDHSIYLSTYNRYKFLFDYKITDYNAWADGLKTAGYATNSQYPKLLTKIIEDYDLEKYDKVSQKEFEKMLREDNVTLMDNFDFNSPSITKDTEENKNQVYLPMPNHNILFYNRIKYIICKKGDDINSLRKEFDLFVWQIPKYNDISKDQVLEPGMLIYLQPKRRNCPEKFHKIKEGETMWEVSQKYGIKLSILYKRNQMQPGTQPTKGQELSLRKKKK